jgi:peptidoglycan/LPS O-acetylase OafA/YrhL
MSNARDTHPDRLQTLDLLRFIAASSVVFYHMTYRPLALGPDALNYFPGVQAITKFGYLGVELFFLISGFVILWSASGRPAAVYVASRVSRIVPSLWVGIGLTCMTLVWFGKAEGIVNFKTIVANMTLVAGYIGLPYVDGVYWTLQAEIKFYVLVFFMIALRQMGRIELWLIAWLGGLAVCYAPFAPGWFKAIVVFPYGSYFVGGSLCFLIWREGFTWRRAVGLAVSLVLSLFCLRQESPGFMNNDASMPTFVIAAAIVACCYVVFLLVALRKVTLPPSTWWFELGALTYPLYLLHNQIGKAFAAAIAPRGGPALALAAAFAIPLLLAIALAKTVERKGCSWLRTALLGSARRIGLAA